jgi:hypothetical protein
VQTVLNECSSVRIDVGFSDLKTIQHFEYREANGRRIMATETEFFERAGMEDTKIAQSRKDDLVDVAKVGYEALMNGEGVLFRVSKTR